MKSFVNSFLPIVILFIVGSLFFNSCQKDNNDSDKVSIPLIASISSFNDDGMPGSIVSFQYDKQGRLILLNENDGSYSSFSYSESEITMKNYNDNKLTETAIISLNDKGLCESLSLIGSTELQTNEYESKGYRKLSINQSGSWASTTTFTVRDGNYVTIRADYHPKSTNLSSIQKYGLFNGLAGLTNSTKGRSTQNRLKSTSEGDIDLTEYLFYTDKINTIDYENWGISFLGKQNKNPVKQDVTTYWDGGIIPASCDTVVYRYEFNAKGRITKQLDNHGDYSVYTYVD